MATSSAECLEEARKLRRQLCEICREVQLDDNAPGFKVRYEDGESVLLKWEAERPAELPTDFFLTDDFPMLLRLKISSRKGCNFCGYLRDMILSKHVIHSAERHCGISTTDSEFTEVKVTIELNWVLDTVSNGPSYLRTNIVFDDGCSGLELWSTVTAAAGSENLANWLPIFKARNRPPPYPHNIEWMKQQIHKCKADHSHTLPSGAYAPERLLDVREYPPRLISGSTLLSEAWGKTPRYTALSYCWGTEEEATHQLKTTRESMPERQRGIHYDEAPPVLRDAVRLTRGLDIPFLWIDALCILQGDNSDWEKQCAQMDNIYGHAEVTLVAASSESCQEGFVQPQVPGTMLPFSSKQRPGFGGLFQVNFLGCTKAPSTGDIFNDIYHSRLGTRGWAVQERILSTRKIIFGISNLQFICPASSSGQQFNGLDYSISMVREKDESLYFWWSQLLNEYRSITVESFTKPTDLLPALSGLAAYFGNRTKDRYCAGHWHKDLYRSLMWRSAKPETLRDSRTHYVSRACSPKPYIVPSWSRLGKSHSYALFDSLSDSLIQKTIKLDAHISHTGENPFGAIRDAQLEVRTHTMGVRTATNIRLDFSRSFIHRPGYVYSNFCGSLVHHDETALPWELGREEVRFRCCVWVDYNLNMKDEDMREDVQEWKWALLGAYDRGPFGLLLSSASDSRWCRVGVFATRPYWHEPTEPSELRCREMEFSDFTHFSSVETLMII